MSSLQYQRYHYYNPVSKIQSLIHNLDAELLQLCTQCNVPKPNKTGCAGSSSGAVSSSSSNNRHNSTTTRKTPITGTVLDRHTGSRATATVNGNTQLTINEINKRQLRNVLRSRVIDAYRKHQIFTIFGNYHTIRRSLRRRGWIEKLPPNRYAKLQALSQEELLQHAQHGNDYEIVAMSKMINHFPSFFIWQAKGQRDMCVDVLPYRNRVRRAPALDFSTKVGLIGCAEQERWFREEGLCGMSHPRFFRLGNNNFQDRKAFIEDFHNTQVRSLLRFIKEQDPTALIDPEFGTISTATLDYALQNLRNAIRDKELCLDSSARGKHPKHSELAESNSFMLNSMEIMKGRALFKTNEKTIKDYATLAGKYLEEIEQLCPDYLWDGCRNLWILKPGFQSRGIGIIIRNSLEEILQWSSKNQNRRYIVQKYIERPLLIYKTKFDIRQYMLLTIGITHITVWLYRDCYLRFSSQEFTLDDLRESIHLTNNSVQKRYKNKQTRDPHLPRRNMWSLEQFKSHLADINAPEDAWQRIYNGFRHNLIAVVMASLDETKLVQNAFELYGCDFMVDEQYNPILLEINSTPDLSPSTEVTARICPTVLKDTIRVVIDLPKDPLTSTGNFERVYELNYRDSRTPKEVEQLELNGTAAILHAVDSINLPDKHVNSIYPSMQALTKTKTDRKQVTADYSNEVKSEPSIVSFPIEKVAIRRKLKERLRLKKIRLPRNNLNGAPLGASPSMNRVYSRLKLNSTIKENLALQYAKVN